MKLRKVLVLLAVLCLAVGLMTVSALAETVDRGSCGSDLTWTLDSAGTLTISGTGEMRDYEQDYEEYGWVIEFVDRSTAPWCDTEEEADSINKVVVKSGVTGIGDYAFAYCRNIQSISLPTSVTSLGYAAFEYCESLKSIKIPSKVEIIPGYAFQKCTDLVSVQLPSGLEEVYSHAFHGCEKLTDIDLPSGLIGIGEYAFTGCHALKSISVPKKVTRINSCTFSGCSSLENVEMPGVKFVEDMAFGLCTSLKEIVFPESLAKLYWSVFDGCTSMKTIKFLGDAPEFDDYVFSGVKATAIYSPNRAWSASDRKDYSGDITWKKADPPTITKQPTAGYAQRGDIVKTTVKAAGEGLTYTWYVRNASADAYVKSSITSAVYSCKMTDSTRNRRVYCVVEDQYGSTVQTETVVLRMAATITEQPDDAKAMIGSKVTVQLSAVGDGLTYAWYFKDAGSSKFTKTSSFTGNTYYVSMNNARDGRQIYCVVTDKYGRKDTSETVTLATAEPVRITTQPKTTYTKQGETAKATVKAEGDGLTYTWYIKNAGKTTYGKSSVTTAAYSVKMSSAAKDRIVYCVVTDKYGNSVESEKVRLRMAATITTQPKNVKVALGSVAKTTVTAVGDGLTYTWYIKNPGKTSFSKSSVTSATYACTMSAAKGGRQIYCVVTDKYGKTEKSDTVTLLPPTIYLNDSGVKYHNDEECAGKTAYESTLSAAIQLEKEPCLKCIG